MGTMVRVTNLENGKDVIVKINDRGPFIEGRMIDLSYAAAKSIGLIRNGTANVKVEVISAPGREDNFFRILSESATRTIVEFDGARGKPSFKAKFFNELHSAIEIML